MGRQGTGVSMRSQACGPPPPAQHHQQPHHPPPQVLGTTCPSHPTPHAESETNQSCNIVINLNFSILYIHVLFLTGDLCHVSHKSEQILMDTNESAGKGKGVYYFSISTCLFRKIYRWFSLIESRRHNSLIVFLSGLCPK